MKNKVCIFTEGGNRCGYGHITRCTALYDEIVSRGFEVELIINGEQSQKTHTMIGNRKAIFSEWYGQPLRYIGGNNVYNNYAIVDSYIATKETYEEIAESFKKAIYIDDTNRIEYPKGIILNPSISGADVSYIRKKDQEYLLGCDYIILRKEFTEEFDRELRKDIKKVLVILGGSDIKNLEGKILEALKTSKLKDSEIIIAKNMSAEEMRDAMLDSDIAITAGGQTVYELIACKLPFVCVKVADNQNGNIGGLIKVKVINDYVDCDEEGSSKKILGLLEELIYVENRKVLIKAMEKIDVIHGAHNIMNLFLNFPNVRD